MKIDFKGLKFQNWLYMMIFSVLILVLLWTLQFILLGSFYKSMKLNETKDIGNRIADQFGDKDFYLIMNDYAFNNNLRIVLLDNTGRIAGNFDGFHSNETILIPSGVGMFPQNTLTTIVQKLYESDSERIAYLYEIIANDRISVTQTVFAAKVYDSVGSLYYLYISSPIPAIDSTVSVLQTQFYIITAILFVLSLVAAQVISRKMSKPIINLTKSANLLVKGELQEVCYENGFTEINQLASAMNYAAGELHSLDKYRKDFIANVSHDLKTPLTIIKFYGEMIKDVSGNNPEKRTEHCDLIIKEADWLTGMVGEILELSKLESGNAEILKTEVNLSRCLTDTLISFRIFTENNGYFFETNIDENLCVYGNEQMLKRVLYNLISNAVNFTGADKRIFVSLKKNGSKIRFEVTDTGEGIEKEKQSAIWDRYYKSNKTHKRAVIGTGIGLSIVKNALSLHDADYGVISETGEGSTFWFEL